MGTYFQILKMRLTKLKNCRIAKKRTIAWHNNSESKLNFFLLEVATKPLSLSLSILLLRMGQKPRVPCANQWSRVQTGSAVCKSVVQYAYIPRERPTIDLLNFRSKHPWALSR